MAVATTYLQNLKDTKKIYIENFVYMQDKRVVINKTFRIPANKKKIVPAKVVNINDELESLYNKRRDLFLEYKLIEDNIVLSDAPQKFKQKYDSIIKDINDIQDQIENVHEYFKLIEQESNEEYDGILADIQQKRRLLLRLEEDENKEQYVAILKQIHDLENKLIKFPEDVDYIVIKSPLVTDLSIEDALLFEEPAAKKKTKFTKLSNVEMKIVKDNIKDLIKTKFKSKTKEECASQKRSQPYYMKKEDILKTIEENPLLKNVLPDNYKTLNKETLCEYLYK